MKSSFNKWGSAHYSLEYRCTFMQHFLNNYKKVLNTNNIKRHCSRLTITSFSTAIHHLSKSCSLAFKNITNNLTKTTFIVYVYTPYFNQTQEIKKWKERCIKYYLMFQGCSAFFQGCQKLNMMKSNYYYYLPSGYMFSYDKSKHVKYSWQCEQTRYY